jgi:hypothetical protein
LSGEAWRLQGKLTQVDNEELTKPFTEEEVKKEVFEMSENSAPGLDGFIVSFYKSSWDTVKGS